MLPKIKQPIFDFVVPSTKKTVRFRPFTVAEEKLVLIAKEANTPKEIIDVYKQLINNCCLDAVDVDKMATFDIEMFFIALRSKSIGNIIEGKLTDDEDGNQYEFTVDLDKVAVSGEIPDKVVKLTDTISVEMKFPDFSSLAEMALTQKSTGTVDMIRECLETIIEGDQIYPVKDHTKQEINDWIGDLGPEELRQMEKFFSGYPRIYCDVTYQKKDGTFRTIRLEGTEHFFAS